MILIVPLIAGLICTLSVVGTLACTFTNFCNREGRRADRLQLDQHRAEDQVRVDVHRREDQAREDARRREDHARMDVRWQQERDDAREDRAAARAAAMELERFRVDPSSFIARPSLLASEPQPSRAEIVVRADRRAGSEDASRPADGDPLPDASV